MTYGARTPASKPIPWLKTCFGLMWRLGCFIPLGLALFASPAVALVRMDRESIDMALKYGIKHQGSTFQELLGPNWIEGPDGILVNVYTPFMLLASRAAKGGFPIEPSDTDLQAARTKYARTIRDFGDEAHPPNVKFALSLQVNSPYEAAYTKAFVEGYAKGRLLRLKPTRSYPQPSATLLQQGNKPVYDAISSYYFSFPEVAEMETFDLVLEPKDKPPIRIPVNNQSIY
jgi:hypothetical protein